jgi:hypothetical protein
MQKTITKKEVIERLSKRLRDGRETMSNETFIKVVTYYAKLMGWYR